MAEAPTPTDLDPLLQSFIGRAWAELIPQAKEKAGTEDAAIFESKNNVLRIVLTNKFNCSVKVADDRSRFSVYVNLGLATFLNEIFELVVGRCQLVSESDWKSGQTPHSSAKNTSIEEVAPIATELMQAFWDERLPNNIIPREMEPEGVQLGLCRASVRYGIRFIIGHEVGHVMLDVSSAADSYRRDGLAYAERILARTSLPTTKPRDELVQDWAVELAADRLGLELALEAEPGLYPRLTQMGAAECFFIVHDMLCRYYLATRGGTIDTISDHPPAHVRWQHLREIFGTNSMDFDLGTFFQFSVNQILDNLCPNRPPMSAIGETDLQRQEATRQLHLALEAEAKGTPECKSGNSPEQQKRLGEAMEHVFRAAQLFQVLDEKRRIVDCVRILGRISQKLNKPAQAAQALYISFGLYHEFGDEEGMRSCGNRLHVLYKESTKEQREEIRAVLTKMGATVDDRYD